MTFSEDDLKKAIEDTRQMLLNKFSWAEMASQVQKFTPEAFYEKVLEYARTKERRSDKVHAGKHINWDGYCDVSDCWCRYNPPKENP